MSEREFNLDLNLDISADSKVESKLKKLKELKYEPTWEEVWDTGYGKKKGILQMKNTELELSRLLEVRRSIESGELGTGLDSLRKASKTYFLNLYHKLQSELKTQRLKLMQTNRPKNYILVDTIPKLINLCDLLYDEHIIALDTETTGLNWEQDDRIVGISMTLPNADSHFYIPVRHDQGEQISASVVFKSLLPFLASTDLKKVLHNAKFDYHMFLKDGIKLGGIVGDTMIIMFLLNENEPSYALKNLATKYGSTFGFDGVCEDYDTMFGKVGFNTVPISAGMVYACKDTHITWELYKWQTTFFKINPKLKVLYETIELPLLQVICDMEEIGLPVDFKFGEDYGEQLASKIEDLELKLCAALGGININSNVQLAEVLYDKWKLKSPKKGRTVDAETLRELSLEKPILQELLDYRELNKLYSTYILPLPNKVGKDRRLHGQFKQIGAKTGRFSSQEPNLQNIPGHARPLIKAPLGKVIVGIDYSQIEPRVLAHLSGDEQFMQPYLQGTDLYSTLASNVFKLPIEECGDGSKYRKMMKVGLLATMYGTSKHTLAKQLNIAVADADQFIKDFLNTYQGVNDFINGIHNFVDKHDYVETIMNRKRRFIGHHYIAEQYEYDTSYLVESQYQRVQRQSVNAVIQGSASDLMKLAMIKVHELLQGWGKDYKMLATIHDEILIEVPTTITKEQVEEIENTMVGVMKLKVPLKVDTAFMFSWGIEMSKKVWYEGDWYREDGE